MQIKTIVIQMDEAKDFDKKVNDAISTGWVLKERKVLQPPAQPTHTGVYFHTMLYAELVKE